MKFSKIAAGTRSRKRVPLPLGEGPLPLPIVTEDGKIVFPEAPDCVSVDLRVLNAEEQAQALSDARAYAIAKGVSDPKRGNDIYDLALSVHELALAVLDVDSPADKPEPFFDKGPEQVFTLDPDRIAYLHERFQIWQDECSPQRLALSPEEFEGHVLAMAVTEDDGPFVQLRPGMRWIFARTLAALYSSARTLSLPSTSASEATGTPPTAAPSEPEGG